MLCFKDSRTENIRQNITIPTRIWVNQSEVFGDPYIVRFRNKSAGKSTKIEQQHTLYKIQGASSPAARPRLRRGCRERRTKHWST